MVIEDNMVSYKMLFPSKLYAVTYFHFVQVIHYVFLIRGKPASYHLEFFPPQNNHLVLDI